MSMIFCVHIITIYGSVKFFLKNVCYVQDYFGKVQILLKDHLVSLPMEQQCNSIYR